MTIGPGSIPASALSPRRRGCPLDPGPIAYPAETGSGPPRGQWLSVRAFVAGGDGGLVGAPSRSAHGHIQHGTRRTAEVEAHITGTVWKIECEVGDEIEEGDTVVILESMKMEMPVEAEDAGTVKEILCEEGQAVNEGDTLVVLE